jgi:hypothetical protein
MAAPAGTLGCPPRGSGLTLKRIYSTAQARGCLMRQITLAAKGRLPMTTTRRELLGGGASAALALAGHRCERFAGLQD